MTSCQSFELVYSLSRTDEGAQASSFRGVNLSLDPTDSASFA